MPAVADKLQKQHMVIGVPLLGAEDVVKAWLLAAVNW